LEFQVVELDEFQTALPAKAVLRAESKSRKTVTKRTTYLPLKKKLDFMAVRVFPLQKAIEQFMTGVLSFSRWLSSEH